MAGLSFMGWSSCSHGLGDNLVSPVRPGCRLGRGGPTFRRVRAVVRWDDGLGNYVGGLLDVAEQLDIGEAAPTLCRCCGLLEELAYILSFEHHVLTPPM
jgi:hypothetical protein